MRPIGYLIFGVICLVVFCWALLELGPTAALMLAVFFGLDDSAVPLGFLMAAAFIIWCIVHGLRNG